MVPALRLVVLARGFTSRGNELELRSAVVKEVPQGFYHPDYRADFEMGDDPHRYYNW